MSEAELSQSTDMELVPLRKPRTHTDSEKAERAHRRGFNGGLTLRTDMTGVGEGVRDDFARGLTAGREARLRCPDPIPPRHVRRYANGRPMVNPEFVEVSDRLYREAGFVPSGCRGLPS